MPNPPKEFFQMSETLVNQIDNKNIYASRAVADEDGTNIKTNYALKSEIPYVPASTSADENKVLTVASDGTPGWAASQGLFIAQYGSTSYADIDVAVRANKIVYCYVNGRFAFLAYTNTTGGADRNYEFQYYRSASRGKDSIFIYKVRPAGSPYGPEWETTERQVKAADTVPTVSSNDDGKVLKATYSGGVGSYSWQAVAGSVTYTTLTAAPTGSAINDIFEGLLNSVSNGRGFAIGIMEGTTKTTWLWPTSVTNSSATTGTAVFSGSVQKTEDGVLYTEIKTLTITAESTPSSSTFVLKSAAALPNVEWDPWSTPADKTMRFQFSDPNYSPLSSSWYDTVTWVQVSSSPNVWDYYNSNGNWSFAFDADNTGKRFNGYSGTMEVLSCNTSGVVYMTGLFRYNRALINVPLMQVSNVIDMTSAFSDCRNVESGAYAMYQKAASESPASNNGRHNFCFYECGIDTVTGAAELAQIPQGWVTYNP
jgi:hypothetical protein